MSNPTSLHISGPQGRRDGFGEWLARLAAAGCAPAVIYSVNVDIAPDCQRYSPTTKIIYRRQDETFERQPSNFFEGDPRASAREWMTVIRNDAGDTLLDNWSRNPANWYDPLNEPAPGTPAQAQWLNEWMLEALSIAMGYGFKLALFSFPTGSPDYSLWQYLIPALQFGKLNGAILSLHAYNNGGLAEKDENGELTPDAIHNAFRHWTFYPRLPESARIPIVYTEASMGNGFGMQPTPTWINDLIEYGQGIKNDAEVLAACAYQLGGSESNCYQALPDLGDAIVSADWSVEPGPVDEWEFDYWEIDGERITANPVEIIMNGPHTITPHARRKNTMQPLTVNPCPEWPGLVVNVEPAGYLYPTGTVVTLKAV